MGRDCSLPWKPFITLVDAKGGKPFQAAIAKLPLKAYNRVTYTSDTSRGFEVSLSARWQQMACNASSLCYAYFVVKIEPKDVGNECV
jgi:hypothetical protein